MAEFSDPVSPKKMNPPKSGTEHSLDSSPMKQNSWNRLEQLTGQMGIFHEH